MQLLFGKGKQNALLLGREPVVEPCQTLALGQQACPGQFNDLAEVVKRADMRCGKQAQLFFYCKGNVLFDPALEQGQASFFHGFDHLALALFAAEILSGKLTLPGKPFTRDRWLGLFLIVPVVGIKTTQRLAKQVVHETRRIGLCIQCGDFFDAAANILQPVVFPLKFAQMATEFLPHFHGRVIDALQEFIQAALFLKESLQVLWNGGNMDHPSRLQKVRCPLSLRFHDSVAFKNLVNVAFLSQSFKQGNDLLAQVEDLLEEIVDIGFNLPYQRAHLLNPLMLHQKKKQTAVQVRQIDRDFLAKVASLKELKEYTASRILLVFLP